MTHIFSHAGHDHLSELTGSGQGIVLPAIVVLGAMIAVSAVALYFVARSRRPEQEDKES